MDVKLTDELDQHGTSDSDLKFREEYNNAAYQEEKYLASFGFLPR